MSEARVAVTGMGVICALGHNVKQFWDALSQGRPAIGAIRSVDIASLRFQNGAEVSDYEPGHYFAPDQLPVLDRFAQFALIAAREALLDSGVSLTPRLGENTAVVCGCCLGGPIESGVSFCGPLSAGSWPRSSAFDPAHHGQRWRKPYFHGVGHYRAGLCGLHRMLIRHARDRA